MSTLLIAAKHLHDCAKTSLNLASEENWEKFFEVFPNLDAAQEQVKIELNDTIPPKDSDAYLALQAAQEVLLALGSIMTKEHEQLSNFKKNQILQNKISKAYLNQRK